MTLVIYEFYWVCPKMIFEPVGCSAQTVHLSCVKFSTISKQTESIFHLILVILDEKEIPHDPRHIGVPSGASKTISEPMVRSAQTVHLSCVKISTISKQTESIFHLNLVT